jgi:hypothetical protein
MSMPKLTIGIGSALVVVGVVAYLGSGAASLTAFIPSVVGVVLVVLGLLARDESRRMMAMHIAVLVALFGLIGGAMRLGPLPDLLTGEDVERPWAVGASAVMVLLLLVFVVLAVRSFVAARKARTAA